MTSYSAKLSKPKIYHEKESMSSSTQLLLRDKEANQFWVTCSKAVLNCLLQREHFKDHVRVRLEAHNLETIYSRLRLYHCFRIHELNNWLNCKADLFGSILAITEALTNLNVNLSPVDDVIYTSLIEKPAAYICLIKEGWVVLRRISGKWYLLDPRTSTQTLSDTYLHLIIKQLITDKGLVFQISGGEFSGMMSGESGTRDPVATEERREDERQRAGEPSHARGNNSITDPETSCSRNSRARNPEPKPPDIARYQSNLDDLFSEDPDAHQRIRQARRDEVTKVMTHLYKLQLGSIISRPRRSNSRKSEVSVERSRSEGRRRSSPARLTEVAGTSGHRQTDIGNSYNDNWPSLEAATQRPHRKSRTQSIPRSRIRQQEYSPPATGPSGLEHKDEKKLEVRWSTAKHSGKDSTCCICLVDKPSHALYPCGHQCLCANCKSDFRKFCTACPICKSPVTDVIRIYTT